VERVADVCLVAAWIAVLGHNLALAARGVAQPSQGVRWAAGMVVLGAVLVAGAHVERASGGRWSAPTAAIVAGVVAAFAGAAVHLAARQTLGAAWSARADRPNRLVDEGAYGVVRHPLYAGLLLLAVGTVAAHPSVAVAAGAVGLVAGIALKMRREERAMAAAFGPAWDAYRRRVPAIVPRRRRRS
jgi:protein-S-isoprenylcysteine O-methyltransferase Ste14